MIKALILLGRGFEEIEAITPIDILRRAGVEVVTASVEQDRWVTGGRGIPVMADKLLSECGDEDFEALILPGGPGIAALKGREDIQLLARRYMERGKTVAAICAAPTVLGAAGLLGGRRVTSFPATRDEVEALAGEYSENRVVEDRELLTSRGAGTAEEFSLALVAKLLGPEIAEKVRVQIVARP